MIILSSINFPTVICSPTVCYFSQEKPLVKPTAPGSYFSYICLCDLIFACFYFQTYSTKNIKILCCTFFYLRSIYSIYYNLFPSVHHLWRCYLKGIDNPFNTSGCEWLLFVYMGCLRFVAWFSYWFDTLVS